jgi:hypothetical protein|tara:strand:+ start:42 stop:380 length:339 start_codon:yes stop_codon:yes gene_type:complete
MYKNEMPKTVARWLEKNREKIHAIDIEASDDSTENGEYSIWVYFNAGWIWAGEMHMMHEYTARDFLSAAKSVRHCEEGCECKWDTDPSEGSVGKGGFAKNSDFKFNDNGKLI